MSNQDEQDDESFAESRLIEAIENQLAAGEPPAAQATLNKLTLVGYAREDILDLMAQVLAYSINLTNSAWGDGSVLGLLYPDEDPGEDVRCAIEIVDLERKFNINRAAEDGMGRYPLETTFELMGIDVSLIPYLVDVDGRPGTCSNQT